MHVSDGLEHMGEAVAALSAVTQDLVVLHLADDMFHLGAVLAVFGVAVLFRLGRWRCGLCFRQLR